MKISLNHRKMTLKNLKIVLRGQTWDKGIIRWSEEKTIDKNKKPPTQILRRWLYLQSIIMVILFEINPI